MMVKSIVRSIGKSAGGFCEIVPVRTFQTAAPSPIIAVAMIPMTHFLIRPLFFVSLRIFIIRFAHNSPLKARSRRASSSAAVSACKRFSASSSDTIRLARGVRVKANAKPSSSLLRCFSSSAKCRMRRVQFAPAMVTISKLAPCIRAELCVALGRRSGTFCR
jgi:hypothetical protein